MIDPVRQRQAWSTPPIGGRNVATSELLQMTPMMVRDWVRITWNDQYGQPSNFDGGYRRHLGLDDTRNKRVMDFGCGFGFDALSYARTGNQVILADIVDNNLAAANAVLRSEGYEAERLLPVSFDWPFFEYRHPGIDVFHASGVLHHTPHAPGILERAAEILAPGGEMRLMLYTNHLFRIATGEDPGDLFSDVTEHPAFARYVRFCDAVGDYADWYTKDRLGACLPEGWLVAKWHYLRPDRGYAVAIVRREA